MVGEKKNRIGKLMAHLVLGIGAVIMVYPLLFVIMASFFTPEVFNRTVISFLPIAKEPTLDNFKLLFFVGSDSATIGYYINSIIRTLYGT